jgi:hypothetical protein
VSRFFSPTSASIQREYVEKRQRMLSEENPARTVQLQTAVEDLMEKHGFRGVGTWVDHYNRITMSLHDSDLTINFDAGSWFSKPNHYDSYTTMYERSIRDGKIVLTNSDPANPATERATADDWVTLPDEWANAHPFSQRKRLYDALSVTGSRLDSDNTPKLREVSKNKDEKNQKFVTTNYKFKPKAKQVFAALNYGARPHGSTCYYGWSHLVLKRTLNLDAIYYPCDTFYIKRSGTTTQVIYDRLGDLVLGGQDLADLLWTSCWECQPLPDTDDGYQLVEAHIFQRVKTDRDVERVVLSRRRKGRSGGLFTDQEWERINKFARYWCQRNGVKLTYANP